MTTTNPEHDAVLVRCTGVGRSFGRGSATVVAVGSVDCTISAGERIALSGTSGSGKSTLLQLIGGMDTPTAGAIEWPGLGERRQLRPGRVGMIFQSPSLVPALNASENVALALELNGVDEPTAARCAAAALLAMGLTGIAHQLPEQLSGGQAQRVAVARVLALRPALVLADEPTGQLDHVAGDLVLDALLSLCETTGAALLLTTHDERIASRLPQRWRIADGALQRERPATRDDAPDASPVRA